MCKPGRYSFDVYLKCGQLNICKNVFQIWDIEDQSCVFNTQPKASLIHGDLSACLYSPCMKTIFIAADHMCLLSLKTRSVCS